MRCEWKQVKLGDVATVKGGKRLPKNVNLINTPNTHPYIRVRDLNDRVTLELNDSFLYVDDETQREFRGMSLILMILSYLLLEPLDLLLK